MLEVVLLVLLVAIVIGVSNWWRNFNSADKRIERLKLRAIDRRILKKAHEIVDELGTNNRYQEGQLVIEREGKDEGEIRRGEYTYTSHWRQLVVRNGKATVFEANNSPRYYEGEEYWSDYIWGYIPGPWEAEIDRLYGRAVRQSEEKTRLYRAEQERERRRRFGIQ